MVLVDTSVWIRFLANKQPYAGGLAALLDRDEVSGHELVFGELLIGDKAGRTQLLTAYALMHQASVVSHHEAVAFVRERRLHGRGAGWIDIHLLASVEDPDGPNAPSHIRASLMSPQILVPLADGKLALGTWQGIFFCEFDGPRDRKVYVTALS